ncbi:MAG: hypothetical protein AAFX50_11260, partial [Acidobacteriota bacterium]
MTEAVPDPSPRPPSPPGPRAPLEAAVVGASGYVGGELLRLLDAHPLIEVAQATSERLRGR